MRLRWGHAARQDFANPIEPSLRRRQDRALPCALQPNRYLAQVIAR